MIAKKSVVASVAAAALFSFFAVPSPAAGRRSERNNPDFTQGGKTDGSHDWTLGATGARGWIYAWKAYMRRQTCTINWSTELPLAQGVKFE